MNDEKILADLERENLRLADKGLRSLAWFIDVFLLSFIFTLIHLDALSQMSDIQGNMDYENLRAFALKFSWQVWILKISYDTLFVWYYGSSIGKILCKMRVVSVDLFDQPSFLYALLRACGKYIGESLLFITYVFGFGDSLSRTLHDRLAKTLVIAY
ncbi:RDD family protein [Helicobacter mastomyrinus]|uniref:RDD family protein n=1 Tax=Helicobacter mastomyrinus TaxID=287948 RepID=A0ABZ3F464_9HELI